MRLPSPPPTAEAEFPLWPPLLATRGPGSLSAPHAHHAIHLVLSVAGTLRARAKNQVRWAAAAGVLTAPDVVHEIDGRGAEVLLVFVDPESEAGAALTSRLEGPIRLLSGQERDAMMSGAEPRALLGAEGDAWLRRVAHRLGAGLAAQRRQVHPRVRKLLRLLAAPDADGEASLAALAAAVGLSPGRLMHAFTSSIGIPLRPYLAWLRVQRAAGAIVSGAPLADAAATAGFADAAHLTRTFRRMLGVPPSLLRPGTQSRKRGLPSMDGARRGGRQSPGMR